MATPTAEALTFAREDLALANRDFDKALAELLDAGRKLDAARERAQQAELAAHAERVLARAQALNQHVAAPLRGALNAWVRP